jgi:hypothetical protein
MRMKKADAPLSILAILAAALSAGIAWPREGYVARSEAAATAEAKKTGAKEEPAELRQRPAPPAVADIAGKFGGPPSGKPTPKVPPPHPESAQQADWLHAVGSFEDSGGCRWILVKDDRRSRVIKLRADGALSDEGRMLEQGAGVFVIEADSKRYSFGGR